MVKLRYGNQISQSRGSDLNRHILLKQKIKMQQQFYQEITNKVTKDISKELHFPLLIIIMQCSLFIINLPDAKL